MERWQLGGILSWNSGAPLDINASTSSINATTSIMTPNLVGSFPKDLGKVKKLANGVTYFDGLQVVTDPAKANVSPLQGLQGAFSNRVVVDSQGRTLLTNPAPGEVRNLGLKWIEGPARLNLDMNLVKRVRPDETREFEFRLDAINILNKPIFTDCPGSTSCFGTNNANLDINSPQISAALPERSGVEHSLSMHEGTFDGL